MRKFIITFLLLLGAQIVSAAGWFTPKSLDKRTELGASVQKVVTMPLTDLFEYPDGWSSEANLDDEGVTISVSSDNTDLFDFRAASYYNYGKYHQIQLNQKAGSGKVKIIFTLSKDNQTASNTLEYDLLELIAADDSFGVNITGPTKVDVLGNDSYRAGRLNDETCTLRIIEEPKLGSCAIDTFHYDRYNPNYVRSALVYTPAPAAINYSRDYIRYSVTLADGTTDEAMVEIIIRANPLVSRIIEFLPAPGQFTNSGGSFNDASCIIGVGASGGSSSVPQASGLISLGGFGGYVIVGFDQPIYNDPQHPYGVDFSIGGNSFVAAYKGVWTEPGAVMVSRDDNGNGLADDEWYELAGSDYWFSTSHRNIAMTYTDPAYNVRYTVPWTTDNGLAGALLTNQFHQQPYFPDPAVYPAAAEKMKDGTLTYTGTLIRSSLDKRVPSYIEFYRCPAFGYCDNKTNNSDLTIARNPYYDDENGKSTNGFDISWAVDRNGNYVDLDHIDFVKIYTAGAVNAGWLGEWSTEVTGVGITTPDPDYKPQDYYINYASITQLQVPVGGTCLYEGLAFKNGRPIKEGTPHWWVDDESVGTIDDNGLFTGKAIGQTVVHFQQYPDAPADEFDVEVVAMTGIIIDIEGNASTVSNDSIACVNGETIYINVESLTQNKSQLNGTQSNRYIYDTYTWSNSNPEIGTIDNGTFRARSVGERLLTVTSDIDPSLADTIKVTVLPIPATELISDPVRIPYYQAAGSLTNDRIFTNGRNARVNMRSIDTELSAQMQLENNIINYDFADIDFGRYPITFDTDAFGVSKTFHTAIVYDADNRPSPRQLLLVSDGHLTGVPVLADGITALEPVSYPAELTPGQASHILTEGAYAWVARSNELARYDVVKGTKVASLDLTSAADYDLAIADDRLTASSTEASVTAYKTDLEVINRAEVGAAAARGESIPADITDEQTGIRYAVSSEGIKAYDADNKLLASLEIPVESATLMAETQCNTTPVAKTASAFTLYELATSVTNTTKTKSSVCTDQENNFSIYARAPQGSENWLKAIVPQANGNIQLQCQFTGTVDADSLLEIRAEAIDHMGASVMTVWPVKISPRIYKPIITPVKINAFTGDADWTSSLDLKSVFVPSPSVNSYTEKNYYIYADEIISSTLPEEVKVSVTDDGILTLEAPQGTQATGEIVVARTTTYKNQPAYGSKTYSATIPVTLDAMASIAEITAGKLSIWPNPAADHINIDIDTDATVEIYSMRGARVLADRIIPGQTVNVSSLPAGLYLVKVTCTDGPILTARLIKQ